MSCERVRNERERELCNKDLLSGFYGNSRLLSSNVICYEGIWLQQGWKRPNERQRSGLVFTFGSWKWSVRSDGPRRSTANTSSHIKAFKPAAADQANGILHLKQTAYMCHVNVNSASINVKLQVLTVSYLLFLKTRMWEWLLKVLHLCVKEITQRDAFHMHISLIRLNPERCTKKVAVRSHITQLQTAGSLLNIDAGPIFCCTSWLCPPLYDALLPEPHGSAGLFPATCGQNSVKSCFSY